LNEKEKELEPEVEGIER